MRRRGCCAALFPQPLRSFHDGNSEPEKQQRFKKQRDPATEAPPRHPYAYDGPRVVPRTPERSRVSLSAILRETSGPMNKFVRRWGHWFPKPSFMRDKFRW